jgi:hypothetical protein
MSATWRDIPRGYYAIEIYADDLHVDDPNFCQTLGYRLCERRTPKTYKTGRTVGRDAFRVSTTTAPGVDRGRLRDYLDWMKWTSGSDVEYLLLDQNLQDQARELFGKLTGRCGFCGKTLTDPDSKMRGIGPECRRAVRS